MADALEALVDSEFLAGEILVLRFFETNIGDPPIFSGCHRCVALFLCGCRGRRAEVKGEQGFRSSNTPSQPAVDRTPDFCFDVAFAPRATARQIVLVF